MEIRLRWIFAGLGFVALLVFWWLQAYPPYSFDVELYRQWAITARTYGYFDIGSHVGFDYLPASLLLLAISNAGEWLLSWFGIIPDFVPYWRFLLFILQLGLLAWLVRLLPATKKQKSWLTAALLFNPAFIWVSWVWGQTDLIVILLWIISLLYLVKSKYIWFIILTLLACFIKPTGLLLLPLQLVLFVAHWISLSKFKQLLNYTPWLLLGGTVAAVALLFPYSNRVAQETNYVANTTVTWNSFNIWFLMREGNYAQTIWMGLPYRLWSGLAVLALMLVPTYHFLKSRLHRKTDQQRLVLYLSYAFLFAFTFNVFLTDMHERYWDFAIVPLIVAAVYFKPWRMLAAILSFTFFMNLILIFPSTVPLFRSLASQWSVYGELISWAHLLTYCVAWCWCVWMLGKSTKDKR